MGGAGELGVHPPKNNSCSLINTGLLAAYIVLCICLLYPKFEDFARLFS